MAISRSSIPQQIMKPGVKKMKQGGNGKTGIISKAKDVLKTLDTTKVMPEKLKKNKVRKGLSKALRLGSRIATGSHPITWVTMIGGAALDEYNKPESVAHRKKIAEEMKERKKQFKITQAEKRKNNIFNKQDKIQLAQKEKENEKILKKYMGGSLNKRRK